MKSIIYIYSFYLLLVSCKDNEVQFQHTFSSDGNNLILTIDTLSYDFEEKEHGVLVSDFFNEILTETKNNELAFDENDSFDWINLIDLKGVSEARAVFGNHVYYSYIHVKLGLVYVSEFSEQNIDEYKLLSHPEFDKKIVDSIVNSCAEFRKSISDHIYN
jgi:hypothetical protein